VLVGGIILGHVALLLYSGWVHSPNDLEANVLAAGYLHLRYGRFDCAQVNPPLSRMAMAVPLLAFHVREDWGSLVNEPGCRPEYAVGREFLENNISSVREIYAACRMVGVLFSVAGAIAVHRISKLIYGDRAALVAVALWCFSPMTLGHAPTVNHDVPGAAVAAFAFLSFRRLMKDADWGSVFISGVAAGLAVLTRTTNAVLVVCWLFAFSLIPTAKARLSDSVLGRLPKAICVLLTGIVILNAGYEFSGTLTRLGDYEFASQALNGDVSGVKVGNRFHNTWLAALPIPLPKEYVRGLDLQQKDFEAPQFKSYLCGQWRSSGWWYYYLLAWCVKTPIGFQAIFGVAIATLATQWWRNQLFNDEWVIALSIVLVFAAVSINAGFTIHYRYVFAAFPFIVIISSRVWRDGVHLGPVQTVCAGLLVGGVASSLFAYPHSLSYFNEWVGGPQNGSHYLLHSSLDWGQDMYALSEWFHKNSRHAEDSYLQCHSVLKLESLGFPRRGIPQRRSSTLCRGQDETEIKPGVYIASVAALHDETHAYDYLDKCEPCDHIGYSINVYRLSQSDIDALHVNSYCQRTVRR
jgi:hypothetical protein